jgi:hypothetical protein
MMRCDIYLPRHVVNTAYIMKRKYLISPNVSKNQNLSEMWKENPLIFVINTYLINPKAIPNQFCQHTCYPILQHLA